MVAATGASYATKTFSLCTTAAILTRPSTNGEFAPCHGIVDCKADLVSSVGHLEKRGRYNVEVKPRGGCICSCRAHKNPRWRAETRRSDACFSRTPTLSACMRR